MSHDPWDDLFECAGPYPAAKEIRWVAPDLSIHEVLALVEKGEHFLYRPRDGMLTICWPVELPQ